MTKMNNYRQTDIEWECCTNCEYFISYQEEYNDMKASDTYGFCEHPENIGTKGEIFSTNHRYTCNLFDKLLCY